MTRLKIFIFGLLFFLAIPAFALEQIETFVEKNEGEEGEVLIEGKATEAVTQINENFRLLHEDIKPIGFEDRGDPSAFDYAVGDFTTDNTWNDLDLSSIVPVGAKAVLFWVIIQDGDVGAGFWLRENGNTNVFNSNSVRTQAIDAVIDGTLISACDSNRVVEYKGSNLTFTILNVVIMGWWR